MGINVRIVDDLASKRRVLGRGERPGIEPAARAATRDGGEGSELIAARAFDLVLTDIDLTNRNGHPFTPESKQDRIGSQLP